MNAPGLRSIRSRILEREPPQRHSRLGRRDGHQRHSREVLDFQEGRTRFPRCLLLLRHQYRVPCGPERASRASQAGMPQESNATFVLSRR